MVLVDDNSTVLTIGDPMPHFTLPSTGGIILNTHQIKDPVLAVIFTCNHCPYAQAYEDRLITLANELEGEGVQLVLVNSNDAASYPEDSFAHMQERAKEKGFPFPYCCDESQAVARAYGALCTPHCFAFGPQRILQYKGRVDDDWEHPDEVRDHSLRNALTALAQGRTPPVQEANAIGCSIKWRE
ncbi:MAG: thioredoxin family protein [Candidatus Peribacteraceae bacterium]|nr:thioredoxin family protein [Candidatus Peribacteria bacterium]